MIKKIGAGIGSLSIIGASYHLYKQKNTDNKYTSLEVKQHNNMKDGIWVTYKNNVYDITNFISSHPGGVDKILLSAGGALEPYWNIYRQHLNSEYINEEILKPRLIGTLIDKYEYKGEIDPYLSYKF